MTDKTIRDLEMVLRKEFGFSSRRSKAGAAVAWRALTDDEETQPGQQDNRADFFTQLPNIIKAKLIPDSRSGKPDPQMICKCEKALRLMRSALAEIDASGGPVDVGAHLSLAIHRLEEALVEAKGPRDERPAA